ncbi:hypothetical protein [Halobacteriovorax sp. DA5]|uniref:hypothetical protein n=1 Tax=Halobacteriovorax sp. DA5 TaxID=2067553 RepID=UPI0011AFC674|nr:hypothetical protein [Halobacteriovorax sp. DA5]
MKKSILPFVLFAIFSTGINANDLNTNFDMPSACEIQYSYSMSSFNKAFKLNNTHFNRAATELNNTYKGGEPTEKNCELYLDIVETIQLMKYYTITSLQSFDRAISQGCDESSDLEKLKEGFRNINTNFNGLIDIENNYVMRFATSCIKREL